MTQAPAIQPIHEPSSDLVSFAARAAAATPAAPSVGVYERLAEDVLARAQERRVKVELEDWIKEGEWRKMPLVWWGVRSVTDVDGKVKYIDRRAWPVADTEIARAYLAAILAEQVPLQRGGKSMSSRRVPWRRESLPLMNIVPPLYFDREVRGDLAYVDLHAAYHGLYSVASLDLDFGPGRYLIPGRIKFLSGTELGERKGVRNSLVGITRARTMNVMRYGVSETKNTHNRYLAPGLWGYLMYTLHAIARQAVRDFGAVYVHTDGYIVPLSVADPLVTHLRENWLMDAGIKLAGKGRVTGCGSYQIAGKGTLGPLEHTGARSINKLQELSPVEERQLMGWRHWLVGRHVPQDLGAPGPTPAAQVAAIRAAKTRRDAAGSTTSARTQAVLGA